MPTQSGKAALSEMGERLKSEAAKKKANEEQSLTAAKSQLDMIRANKELAGMYQESQGVGSENLNGLELPLLKVHAAGRSSTNILVNGEEPGDGMFFYKPTKEAFKEVECHILTISKGYRADGLQKKAVFNQILAGAMVDGLEIKPFIMYFSGLKLSYLWQLGKDVQPYVKAKPLGIPLFALKVKLVSEKVTTDFGRAWVVKFEIMKNEDGSPVLITDVNLFKKLKENVSKVKEMIDNLIETKIEDDTFGGEKVEEHPVDVEEIPTSTNTEDVSEDEIPF